MLLLLLLLLRLLLMRLLRLLVLRRVVVLVVRVRVGVGVGMCRGRVAAHQYHVHALIAVLEGRDWRVRSELLCVVVVLQECRTLHGRRRVIGAV